MALRYLPFGPLRSASPQVDIHGLVEAKESVIENMAPVLTRLFTLLFAHPPPAPHGPLHRRVAVTFRLFQAPMKEADTCRRFVVPEIQAAGWETEPHRINEQVTFTDGRTVVVAARLAGGPASALIASSGSAWTCR
jgi:hypothetical protein